MAVSVGKYRLLKRIAVGGMAEIFLAEMQGEAGFQRKVIIKKILPHYAGEPDFVRRLVDEGLLASRLTHGNIVQVLDLGRLGPDYFIAMEFVDGIDLRDVLAAADERQFTIPVPIGLHILWQVARALSYAHDKRSARDEPLNIIHRDISPANVFISWEGSVKLGDFGIAKASQRLSRSTMTGVLQGKFPYMSPEQTEGNELTQASDVFSFGILAYELMTGVRPFAGESDMQTLARVREARCAPIASHRPALPPAFCDLVHTCLARDLATRYGRGAEVERALAHLMQDNGWVVSEADVAEFLSTLFGDRRRSVADELDESQEGEVLEASPLDPYDLRAGLPSPAEQRRAKARADDKTRAVPQPTWANRRKRRNRLWYAWLAILLFVATFLALDYTSFHLLLSPPTPVAEAPAAQAAAPPDVAASGPQSDARGIDLPAVVDVVESPEGTGEVRTMDGAMTMGPADITETATDTPAEVGTEPVPDTAGEAPEPAPDLIETRPEPTADLHREPARTVTRLTAMPDDVIVSANGRVLGEEPQNIMLVEGGRSVMVELMREGYRSESFELRYPGPRKLFKRLVPLPTGRLVLRYFPAAAEVLVDGRPQQSKGGLNIIDVELPVGSHVVRVRHGRNEATRTIQIEEGREWRGTLKADL